MASWAIKALVCLLAAGCQAAQASPEPGAQAAEENRLQAAARELDQFLAQRPPSELTGRPLPASSTTDEVRLLVFSHAYGSPARGKTQTPLPSPALTAKCKELAALRPKAVVSVGDFVYYYHPESLAATTEVFRSLGAPVINAVGNHEMSEREKYIERFGNTFGALRLNKTLMITLDTELDPWQISGEQLKWLQECLALAPAAGIERLLIFAHKLIFSVGNERYGPLLASANGFKPWPGVSNFAEQVLPLLLAFTSLGHELLWVGGDIGVPWSYGLFYDHDPKSGITYLCTGMGDQPWDNVLELSLPLAGKTKIRVIPLTANALPGLDECGPAAWAKRYPRWKKRLPKLKEH